MALKASHVIVACLATAWVVVGAIAWMKTSERGGRGQLASPKERGQTPVTAVVTPPPRSVSTLEEAPVIPVATASAGARPAAPDLAAEFSRTMADVVKEPRDATWARDVETRLTAGIKDPKLGPVTVNTVHCGSTRCLFEASASNFHNAMQLSQKLTRVGADIGLGRGRIWRAPPSEGPIVVKAVLARDGFRVDGSKKPPKKSARSSGATG